MNQINIRDLTPSSPKSLTIIATYQCTASCNDCCFSCTPKIKERLSKWEMINSIDNAKISFPNLEIIVFTGGECFMLGDDLFEAIEYATKLGLKSRCVTNGYWGRNKVKAKIVASRLKAVGITEMNISTGLDHQEWINSNTVINSAEALVMEQIKTIVLVEKDSENSDCLGELHSESRFSQLLTSTFFSIQSNCWMPFKSSFKERKKGGRIQANEGCAQLYNNVVVTPHNLQSACCGLTFEYIPEMKVGDLLTSDIGNNFVKSKEDYLKLWIHTDGPKSIIEQVMGPEFLEREYGVVEHGCQACVYLHKDARIVKKIKEKATELAPGVIARASLAKTVKRLS